MAELVEKFSVKPSGILHLGANVGEEAPDYDRAGVEKVIWVECRLEVFPALDRVVKKYPGHRVFMYAASDQDDKMVDLHKTSNGVSSSLLELHKHLEKHPEVSAAGTEQVHAMTVDTIFKRHGIMSADFDFLNMDLQGGEMLALLGMKEYLKSCRWIYTEINTEELYKKCVLFKDLDSFLTDLGFHLIEKRMWSDFHAWGDALYAR